MTRPTPPPAIAISSTTRAMRLPRKALADLIRFVVARQRVRVADVDLAVVSARQIAALNRRFLNHAGPTDVISFNLAEPGQPVSAQLIVCADVALAQARRRNIPPRRELFLYVVHGLLHTFGYDDAAKPQAAKMAARQERLLAEFLTRG
ncbi:MAG: rRNA maturation RNase YbeY [Planctomycetota bacterium]|nr:rRNA maturation RNase YbeY [Planctomycetota bacterium]